MTTLKKMTSPEKKQENGAGEETKKCNQSNTRERKGKLQREREEKKKKVSSCERQNKEKKNNNKGKIKNSTKTKYRVHYIRPFIKEVKNMAIDFYIIRKSIIYYNYSL